MAENATSEPVVPVYKVGLVLLRDVASGDPELFLTQVAQQPKHGDAPPNFGLPKGTRKFPYRDHDGKRRYKDASTPELALKHADHLEPMHKTLLAEVDEEAGLGRRVMRAADLFELGPRPFQSSRGKAFDIQWYVMEATPMIVDNMNPHPREAQAGRWIRLSALDALIAKAEAGEAAPGENINRGYLDVAREAAAKLQAKTLTPFSIPFGPQTTR